MSATIIPFRPRKRVAEVPDIVEFDTRADMIKWMREELDPEDYFDLLEAYSDPSIRDALDPEMIEMLDCFVNLE
jgi:hypothetical protein